MAYAAVISLQKVIQNLLNSRRISLAPPSPQIIQSAYQELKSLQKIMKRLDKSSKSNSRKSVNALDTRIKEAVWKFQDLLESHVYDQIIPQSHILGSGGALFQVQLQELRHDVDSFTKMLKEKEGEYIHELDNQLPEEPSHAALSPNTDSGAKKFKMIGSSDLLTEIRAKLKPPRGFDVISVFGMAGVGKTTLAREIFDDPLIFTEWEFECRAWVTIGRKWELDKLKRDILIQLDPTMDPKIKEGGQENEGHYLKEILKAKRCLIVLDDIWDRHVWDRLKSSLPKQDDGRSRILVTTRLKDVAIYARQSWLTLIHTMELLKEDESWDLLRQKVFGEEDCPPEFIKAGKKIAKKCDGLPLMIVTVADFLSKAEKTVEYWENVAEKKNHPIFMAAYHQILEVLYPSYEYLPQHLKPCFLHMGVFPQDYYISKSKLLSMWIAEGFLEPDIELTMEECSQKYLGELIDHSVAVISQTSNKVYCESGDDIKTCRLHSTFWHLCNKEATNNKFFRVLSSYADGLDQDSMNGQRRLSVHTNMLFAMNDVCESVEDGCASTARSLLFYGPYHPYQVPLCLNLRLLKLLDAHQIRFYEFPIQVVQLVYLSYLALTYNGELPASISKLWNLQFLIMQRNMRIKSSGVTSYVPIEIWDMKELKRIQIMGSNLPDPSSGASLESLVTLTGVGVETCTREVLERISNLTKLAVEIELHPDDDMKALHCLNHIDVLSELRSLKCVVVNPKLRSEIVALPAPLSMFPSSLTKLHLSGLGYPWKYMSIIASLPYLEVLKLQCYAFRGPKWEVESNVFWRLRYLLIEGTDLVQFKVQFGGLPWLKTLCLKHCYKLQHFLWDLRYPLKIEVIDCSPSTVAFANEMGSKNYKNKIIVDCSWEDGKLK